MTTPSTAIARLPASAARMKLPVRVHHDQTDITAEQIERPVRQVQNLHQSVDEGKSRGQQEQQHPEGDAVQSLDDPERHRGRVA